MGNDCVELAKEAVFKWVVDGERISPPSDLPAELREQQRGVFVTLNKNDQLRGCMGTFEPVEENIAREIIRNSISAASKDPRFPPLQSEDLKSVRVKVDILTEPEPAEGDELDPSRYGVIVKKGPKRGVLLPDLEGVDDAEQQLEIVKRKAGIAQNEGDYELYRFQVNRHTADQPIDPR